MVCLQQRKSLKALLYKCYAQRGFIGTGGKEHGARILPGQYVLLSASGSNNKYSNKVIAKMLHLSTEMYKNEQVSKVLRQKFS